MPVTDLLRRNAREHGEEVALIELNPTMEERSPSRNSILYSRPRLCPTVMRSHGRSSMKSPTE